MSSPSSTHNLPPPIFQETLRGVLERITFYNEENHFCIGTLRSESDKNTVTITGPLPSVQCGETLELQGEWVHHPQYGKQFKFSSFESKLPSSIYGIQKYLSSGLIPGIGKHYAEKIVDHFKEDTFRILSEESARLKEVQGLGPTRIKAIKKAWDDQRTIREVLVFLKTYGVNTSQCLRLIKKYGDQTISILKTNPYKIANQIEGIGFKTADKIALNIGIPNDSPLRLETGISYTLNELTKQGHTCYPLQELLQKSYEHLSTPEDKLYPILNNLLLNKSLAQPFPDFVQLPALELAETIISDCLSLLLRFPSQLPPIHIPKAIDWAQTRAGFQFAPEQAQAVQNALSNKVSIITGGPGTGKTTILRAIVDILKSKKVRILLAAPTGRASQRLSESTGAQAQTIHRLLKFDPVEHKFVHSEENPLSTDFIIVDEASMIDTLLAKALLRAIPYHAHVLFVGDINQLPSVGPGTFLQTLIDQPRISTTYLQQIFRQSHLSSIVSTAHSILNGQRAAPNLIRSLLDLNLQQNANDLFFIKAVDPEDCLQSVLKLYLHTLPKAYGINPTKDIQILVPTHRGTAGISSFNQTIQKALIKNTSSSIPANGSHFYLGDKVIQNRNNYDKTIFNGDLGQITKINPDSATFLVDFDGQIVELERMDLPDLALAYAISIHKSQGSEFPYVIIPLLKQHHMLLQRNLIYTAITRGKKKVFVVGDPVAYAMAVGNTTSTNRFTGLPHKLSQKLS